jgi:Polyketide cyclase / dehydrase and lipid transport
VREVVITERDGTVLTSAWSVNFRNGVLRWTERDRFDQHNRVIEFTQLDGDFAGFDGRWRVVQKPEAVDVEFTAVFGLGMASLAAILDPIAEQALRDNIELILRGLLGTQLSVAPGDSPADALLAGRDGGGVMARIVAYTSPARGHLYPITPILDELPRGRYCTLDTRFPGASHACPGF